MWLREPAHLLATSCDGSSCLPCVPYDKTSSILHHLFVFSNFKSIWNSKTKDQPPQSLRWGIALRCPTRRRTEPHSTSKRRLKTSGTKQALTLPEMLRTASPFLKHVPTMGTIEIRYISNPTWPHESVDATWSDKAFNSSRLSF